MLDFGVEGIAWILTPSRKTLLIRPNHRLEVYNWTDKVPLFGEYAFCFQRILEEEEVLPEDE